MEGRTVYRQHMTVFWSRAEHHVTTSLMKLAVGERNVATNLDTTPGCVIEYCFSILNYQPNERFQIPHALCFILHLLEVCVCVCLFVCLHKKIEPLQISAFCLVVT